MLNKISYFWASWCIAVIYHAVSGYSLSSNMKIREPHIKLTGNITNTCVIDKRSYVLKTTKAVLFYP